MKIYSISLGVKILGGFCSFAGVLLGYYLLSYFSPKTAYSFLQGIGCILFSLMALLALVNGRIFITNEKLVLHCNLIFFKTNQEIPWDKVERISTDYFFMPQFCIFKILPIKTSGLRKIDFPIRSYSIELSKEIFSKIPDSTKVELYPWLEKYLTRQGVKLERFKRREGEATIARPGLHK